MKPLKEIQNLFAQALFDSYTSQHESAATQQFLPLIRSTKQLSAQRRLAIYSGSVFANLSEALSLSYPLCSQLYGESFHTTATAFIQQYPSAQQNLNHYGSEFAAFLQQRFEAADPFLQQHPCLVDLASLEWAWDQLLFMADAPADAGWIARLAQYPAAMHLKLICKLHPTLVVLSLKSQVFEFWQTYREQSLPVERLRQAARDVTLQPQDLALWRLERTRQVDPLSASTKAFLLALRKGLNLGVLLENELQPDVTEALPQLLPAAVKKGWIVDFIIDDREQGLS